MHYCTHNIIEYDICFQDGNQHNSPYICYYRRGNSSSFRSDRATYGSYSPTSPLPLYDNVSGAKDAKGSPIRLDDTTEDEPQVDDTSTSEDKPVVEDKKAEKKESSQASSQDGRGKTPNEDESSEEDSEERELKPNSSPAECSKIKDQKSSGKVEDDGPSGVENGIAKSNVEETDASSYVSSVTLNIHIFHSECSHYIHSSKKHKDVTQKEV